MEAARVLGAPCADGHAESDDQENERVADDSLPDPGRVGDEARQGEKRDQEAHAKDAAKRADGVSASPRGEPPPDALIEVEHDDHGDYDRRAGLVQSRVRHVSRGGRAGRRRGRGGEPFEAGHDLHGDNVMARRPPGRPPTDIPPGASGTRFAPS